MSVFELPSYAALATRNDGYPVGTAWGIFGADDEIGTLNLLDQSKALAGIATVRSGDSYPLNWQVDLPSPNPWRPTPIRTQVGQSGVGRDDFLSPFYLQYSSQWDGLRHIQTPGGFYNGVSEERVDDPDSTTLGIDIWARRGIVGRGVLLDVARAALEKGTPIDPATRFEITPLLLNETAELQGVTIENGDVLLVRTGWVGWYGGLSDEDRKAAYAGDSPQPGLSPGEEMAAWLWDHHVAAVAADNSALEASPLDMTPGRFLHTRLIAGFGMAIGEHFWLDDLATACARTQRWTFLFVSAPLNVPGGVGSPPNAIAIL